MADENGEPAQYSNAAQKAIISHVRGSFSLQGFFSVYHVYE